MGVDSYEMKDAYVAEEEVTNALRSKDESLMITCGQRCAAAIQRAGALKMHGACGLGKICKHFKSNRKKPKHQPRQNWKDFLKDKFNYSPSKANRCILVFELVSIYKKFMYCDMSYTSLADMSTAIHHHFKEKPLEAEKWLLVPDRALPNASGVSSSSSMAVPSNGSLGASSSNSTSAVTSSNSKKSAKKGVSGKKASREKSRQGKKAVSEKV